MIEGYPKTNLCRIMFDFYPGVGGLVVHTLELCNQISPYLNSQVVITAGGSGAAAGNDDPFPFQVYRVNYTKFRLLGKLKAKAVRWLPVAPLVNLSLGLSVLKKLKKLDRQYSFDIIQGHGVNAGVVATIAGWVLQKPAVWMMHGTSGAYSKTSGVYESLLLRLFKPDHLLVLDDGSPAVKNFRKILKNRVTVVCHGIDINKFSPGARGADGNPATGSAKKLFTVLSPHSLAPVKGIEDALKAFALFVHQNRVTNARLLVLGGGRLRQKAEALAGSLKINNYVLFCGAVEHSKMPAYYAACDAVIATSLYSNMNRAVQEAMACARPVAVFSSGGTSMAVKHNHNGLAVEPGNNPELAQGLLRLYRDEGLRRRLGFNARKFIIKKRNWQSRIQVELGVYRACLNVRV